MKSVSLKLSDQLISQSSDIAKKLGISRMAFIRQAIEHEIERIQKNRELGAMKASLIAMQASPDYWEHQQEWQDTTDALRPVEVFGGNDCIFITNRFAHLCVRRSGSPAAL